MMENAVEQSLTAARHAKLYGRMCNKLAVLVGKLVEPLPALNAERHRWQMSGVQAFGALQMALEKSLTLLQYCSLSSKLYLAMKGLSILYKFEGLRDELEQSVKRLSILVPQHLALQMAELETEIGKSEFFLDADEKQVGAEIISLLLQKQKGGHFENPQAEEETFIQIGRKLGLTSSRAINLEKKALKRLLGKAQSKEDRRKEATISHILYMIKNYSNALQRVGGGKSVLSSHYSFSRLSWSGRLGDAGSEKSHDCSNCNCSEVGSEIDVPSIPVSAKLPLAPEEFRCPISLQLMSDPVIVASGQTYERVCIEKWFREGHASCPKTQQRLEHLNLTPNYCVKGLIAGWCEAHGIPVPEPPSPPPSPDVSCRWEGSLGVELSKGLLDGKGLFDDHLDIQRTSCDPSFMSGKISDDSSHEQQYAASVLDYHDRRTSYPGSLNSSLSGSINGRPDEREMEITEATSPDGFALLLMNLKSRSWEVQCTAAEQIRHYTKNSAEARLLIGQGGAIPSLVDLLYFSMDLDDLQAQETCALALLNVAVNNDRNKLQVVNAGAVPFLVKLLRIGETQSVKEAAAAALLTLSCLKDNKACIGSFGAIPLLVQLLVSGSNQGIKDALTTLYNLTIFMGNRNRVIRAGAIPILIHLLSLRKVDLVEKCGALLYNLSFTAEGRASIAQTENAVSTLAEILETGSVREREHVAATLLLLCTNSSELNQAVLKEGVIPALVALSVSGTPRAQEKSSKLLQHFREQRQKNVLFLTEDFHNYSGDDVPEGGKGTPASSPVNGHIPPGPRRLAKSRSMLLRFSCKARMCSLQC